MSSSRRLSKQSDTNSEFTLECKAAFLSIYDDIGDKIESKKRLNNVLQQSGRNPTRAALDKYWTRDTESLSFSDFVEICRKEPVTTADDLMKAFRKIDVNGDGYISLDELYKIMNAQGENMSREDVRKMIDEVDENKDGKLDYGEMHSRRPVIWRDKIFYDQFTNMIMKTTEESKKCSMKVMERKERKKRREEKQRNAATNMDSDFNTKVSKNNETETTSLNVEEVKTPKNIESHLDESDKEQVQGFIETETKEENNFGSKVSLRSNKKEKMAGSVASLRSGGKGDEMGSQRSVRTLQGERVGSQVSVRVTDDLGSKTSLRSKKDNTGSQISLKQASEGEMSSVTQEKQDNMGSKASLRSVKESENAAKTNDMGSKASLRSVKESETSAKKDNMGSKASLRSIKESETSAKKDNMGSKASLRSIKESEIAAKKDNMGSKASLRSIKESEIAAEAKATGESKPGSVYSANKSIVYDRQTESPKKDSPKASPRSRSDSAGKSSLKKGTTPREIAQKDSGTKESQKREHHGKNDKPPLPDSPKSKDSGVEKTKPKAETPRPASSKDSARSVGEEIAYDDDFDIVSTGRPTPRVDLNAPSVETPGKEVKDKEEVKKKENEETAKSEEKKGKDAKESAKHVKGNTSNRLVDSLALANTANGDQDKAYDTKSGEMKSTEVDDERKPKKDKSKEAENRKDGQQIDKAGKSDVGDLLENNKTINDLERKSNRKDVADELIKPSASSLKASDGTLDTTHLVDEIFKSSRNARSVLAREFELIANESTSAQPSSKDESEMNSKDKKLAKSQEATPKVPPRKDRKHNEKEGRNNENSLGSQTSLRSGDKEISAPVPSPRKSVSRLSEDDVPRPSPRVRSHAKGKSPSTKNKDKLPDPKTLQDWKHFTSKGCFFYEEDEIVTHLYSLKLTEDSCVYLSACPIDEPACLNLPGTEPVDTALFVFDSRGKLVTCTEQRDTKGTYSVKCDLSAGEYQVLPYTTGCRFRKRPEDAQDNMKESKLVKTKDSKIVITSAFRKALEDIFDLCDLDGNGTMSRDEFNWFNVRTSGEELGEDEWEVVEEKTELENGEITKQGFIELNEMEAEDAQGDVEDLWITLSSMGMNKGLIMDEACPFRVDVYIEESGRKKPYFKVAGIESLEKKEFVSEICQYTIDKADEPTKIRNMKDLYMYTYKNEFRATIVIDNRSRSNVTLQVNCSKSKNVVSNRPELDHTLDIDPQDTVIAHHLLPKSELSDWTVSSTETIHK